MQINRGTLTEFGLQCSNTLKFLVSFWETTVGVINSFSVVNRHLQWIIFCSRQISIGWPVGVISLSGILRSVFSSEDILDITTLPRRLPTKSLEWRRTCSNVKQIEVLDQVAYRTNLLKNYQWNQLHPVISQSISPGQLQEGWRNANIAPMYTLGIRQAVSNYKKCQ